MVIGKKFRLGRIFQKDGRSLVVALDHSFTFGPMQGIEKPGETIEKVIEGGADAIMTSYGIIKEFHDLMVGRVGTILRLDSGGSIYSLLDFNKVTDWHLIYSVEEAVRLGVDGVIVMGFFGAPCEAATLEILGYVAEECHKWGMPLLAETLPMVGNIVKDAYDVGHVSFAARIGQEYGADFIKTNYTGSPESFRKVIENCSIPVLIAGGAKMETPKDVLGVVRGAIDAGGKGVVFGRNIWQYKNPTAMTRAIAKIIHQNATVEEALKEL
ncbi:MAG: fructose-bisphosphate aldolase [Candidatus Freyarchaeota archaeon]|nr:fructose-bisphosphate aldolase [Candidatus Jordarchaeia archaeon]MBS7269451.1 fructose-bisphosphate aldolase [Candidatus Jordarchaeia archaeon]MBS7279783.1 fructose-bisphosphate aldolase [Candidatus Jordarchaeia archaeon]